ncbi:alpha/beta hydrolase [Rhodococcus sp. NPDC057014]|uniref:alpha/beta hydrolase n=1 Tax=Rhodococcus sp. NPDC057014 TaxID=3346000 RepID=UPI00363A2D02
MKRDVEFAVQDGTLLRGYLHSAPAGGAAPGVVMAHGFSGVKEQIDHYAALFAEAGFSTLVFDHRSFGASDGLPRYEVDPYQQLADWQDAITFALTQPEVDEALSVGVFGSSYAGGLAMVLAACDARIGTVVAQIPNVSGHRNAPLLLGEDWIAEVKKRGRADRTARLAGGEPDMVPVFSTEPDELCALPPAVGVDYIERLESETSWRNTVTLRSVEHLIDFEPAGWVPYVAPKPLLMVLGENDVCTFTEVQRAVFDTAGEPKKLVVHPGGHFDTYTTHFGVAGVAARDWFVEHKPVRQPVHA